MLAKKRKDLAAMNNKQIEEFRKQKMNIQAEDNAFAIEANKQADLKEKMAKMNQLEKQRQYAIALKIEIGQKQKLKEYEKISLQKDVEKDILMIKDQVDKEI